ncbi:MULTISPECIES: LysR family transcriptional regulator [Chromohalobacter]|uniref:Transcriptional regulator, LysR family n=1 Tax=Chromohalobacter canadensis TaxID=141389 RepID=A0A285VDH1_9GAMM|nr:MULTISPECIES: LysR family transcriptional regulator [Chromohalobacter]MCK0753074.1 LysR family transcriptional regulator [Chromohalobacter japonicus]SOC52192.1 transcriptional regulator, LysR family [Chromohalobacter canadensis]
MNGINRLDVKQMRVLEALLRERNLSRVAADMGLTQQAISEQLRKLRALFDDRLFLRQGNAMTATPLALELGEKVSRILRDIDALLTPADFTPATYEGVVTISATDYASQAILPDFLRRVRRQAPSLRLIVKNVRTDQVERQLMTGELDLALSFPDFLPPSLPYLTLFEDRHICVASPCSPLHGRALDIAEVAALPQLVISPSRADLKGSHDQWFARQGLERHIVMSVPSFKAAPDVLYTTDLIAFYPARLLPNPKVAPLEVDFATPTFEVAVAWHPRTRDSAIHRWMIDLLSHPASDADEQATGAAPGPGERSADFPPPLWHDDA